MKYFYFFKVTLSYFDDEEKTFFITPDQSETDEQGIPFSENELRNTEEFKEFVKMTKADVIDVAYIEYAVEYDPKKSDILGKPVTQESFAELDKSGRIEVVDENQFPVLLKKKTSSGSKSGIGTYLIICAAAFVVGILAGASFKGGNSGTSETTSETPEVSETSEGASDSESSAESVPDEQSAVESIISVGEMSESTPDVSAVQSAPEKPPVQSTASATTSTTATVSSTAPKPSEAVSSVASSVTSSQSSTGTSSEGTHEAVTASSDVSD